jgi:hypothetical protein
VQLYKHLHDLYTTTKRQLHDPDRCVVPAARTCMGQLPSCRPCTAVQTTAACACLHYNNLSSTPRTGQLTSCYPSDNISTTNSWAQQLRSSTEQQQQPGGNQPNNRCTLQRDHSIDNIWPAAHLNRAVDQLPPMHSSANYNCLCMPSLKQPKLTPCTCMGHLPSCHPNDTMHLYGALAHLSPQ